jgi:hypothetical protein
MNLKSPRGHGSLRIDATNDTFSRHLLTLQKNLTLQIILRHDSEARLYPFPSSFLSFPPSPGFISIVLLNGDIGFGG